MLLQCNKKGGWRYRGCVTSRENGKSHEINRLGVRLYRDYIRSVQKLRCNRGLRERESKIPTINYKTHETMKTRGYRYSPILTAIIPKRLLQCNNIIYYIYLSLSLLVFETYGITFRGSFAKKCVTGVLLQICVFCYIVTRGKIIVVACLPVAEVGKF
jgi:hypothetical protein